MSVFTFIKLVYTLEVLSYNFKDEKKILMKFKISEIVKWSN